MRRTQRTMRRFKSAIGGIGSGLLCVAAAVAISIASSAMTMPASAQDAAPPATAARVKAGKPKPTAASAPTQVQAQGPTKDPAASLAAYSVGVKAYQAGKFDAAVASLSNAINGGLATNLIPKALYYRGSSYEKQGQSGQAISDLNSALWFKLGLDDSERRSANASRTSAYATAGMSVPGPAPRQNETTTAVDNVAETGSLPEAQKPTSGLGAIFGNMFGGETPAAKPPIPTSVAQPAAAAPPKQVAANETEILPWTGKGAAAKLAPIPSQPEVPPVSVSGKPLGKPSAAKKPGAFRIQVAAVKSRDEASAVISKLQTLGGAVAAMPATVDETKFGTMGTFFRVRLGPFASAAETKEPCAALKANGLDCLVTAK